jgi:hypothetical protein
MPVLLQQTLNVIALALVFIEFSKTELLELKRKKKKCKYGENVTLSKQRICENLALFL